MSSLRRSVHWTATIALAACSVLSGAAATARTRATGDLKLTLVARVCADYGDVMANRERDNNMQSLENLGKDSVYSAGQPVAPGIEAANDPRCTPLTGWRFTLGSGIGGETQGLSTVTPAPGGLLQATTLASVPELDANRNDTGRTLAGAVTVDLDDSLITVANNRRLQIQGGTPTDPLNGQLFGNTYSFATLRCAVDNQRADNVDRAAYPTGSSHVFCYYYAIRKPSEPGTIVVRKRVTGGSDAQRFTFTGNVSYTPDNSFPLTAGPGADGSQSFRRAASTETGEPWTVAEQVPAGWTLTDLDCASADGTSTATTTGAAASVRLAAGDTVTCTYTNAPADTVAPLTLLKRTDGGTGGPFAFTADSGTAIGEATTTSPGTAVPAGTRYLPIGRHTVRESLLDGWSLTDVQCQGAAPEVDRAAAGFALDLTASGATCTVTNTRQSTPSPTPTPSPEPTPTPTPIEPQEPSATPSPAAPQPPQGRPNPPDLTDRHSMLPETGTPRPGVLTAVAAGLALAGAGLLFVTRRRRQGS